MHRIAMKPEVIIAALYHFNQQPLKDIESLQSLLLDTGKKERIQGTLLLAPEGRGCPSRREISQVPSVETWHRVTR